MKSSKDRRIYLLEEYNSRYIGEFILEEDNYIVIRPMIPISGNSNTYKGIREFNKKAFFSSVKVLDKIDYRGENVKDYIEFLI